MQIIVSQGKIEQVLTTNEITRDALVSHIAELEKDLEESKAGLAEYDRLNPQAQAEPAPAAPEALAAPAAPEVAPVPEQAPVPQYNPEMPQAPAPAPAPQPEAPVPPIQ